MDSANDNAGLRTRRIILGLSQQALAQEAQCSVAYVRLLEGGFQPNASDVLPRIEQVLEMAGAL